MTEIVHVTGPELVTYADEMAELLVETVEEGSSVGFLAPLEREAAAVWWRERAAAVEAGQLALWIAREGGRVSGTIALVRAPLPNARHRAEVAKLMVRPSARGQGLGRALLDAVEAYAASEGITLLILDTETGSPAEQVYRKAGWTAVGSVPGYAADPAGSLKPTTFYYKELAAVRAGGTTSTTR
ncbi:GNAT family N-acetyltransferase [Streptomyces pratensis]|uniref:GNAT family N-acetyltransferase n=1 Tax=Streptomyces pratensis TaxID=1169025 RepID=UPI00301792EC